ncbi:MAG: hypothetical protein A2Y92_05840 [Chloroflexi bacterium RBG_13_57_8]|nr:MAG: hypothetical protein A2Y92_05840 [Chloroflexi bacterium RBG_13_57_8]
MWRFLRIYRLYLIILAGLALCIIFAGLDNPTGIVLGWLAVTTFILALARRWRRPLNFLILLAAVFFGAIFLSALYWEVALRLAEWLGGPNATDSFGWRVFHEVMSNIILLVTPPGLFTGFFGFIVTGIASLITMLKKRRAEPGT